MMVDEGSGGRKLPVASDAVIVGFDDVPSRDAKIDCSIVFIVFGVIKDEELITIEFVRYSFISVLLYIESTLESVSL